MVKGVGIIGLGNVGEAVLASLKKNSSLISRRTSLKIQVKKICDINPARKKIAGKYSLDFTSKPSEIISDPDIDIVVELTGKIEPAFEIIMKSLKNGKSVVTANKALLAQKGNEIFSLAKHAGKKLGFEASVCGAIPIIRSVSQGLVGCEVNKIFGILNGTTNYILYKMGRENIDFSEALNEAKKQGFAEKNPYLDIEGVDTLHKLCILCYLCYGVWPSLSKVHYEGISGITLLDIIYARELGYTLKLLAIAKKETKILDIRVHPTLIPADNPLAGVSLAYNAVYFDTYPAGELLFYGEGAGGVPTSSSVISDIVNIASGGDWVLPQEEKIKLKNIKQIKSRYYIRFMAQDRPGVLAKISKVLSSLNISIASVTQKERRKGRLVPIIMVTHEALENNIKRALSVIDKFSLIKSPSLIVRIENL